MKLDQSKIFKEIKDPLQIASELDKLAKEYEWFDWDVERGPLGTIILKLNDGEVHYIPSEKGIEEHVYRYDPNEIKESKVICMPHNPDRNIKDLNMNGHQASCYAYLAMKRIGMKEKDINKIVSEIQYEMIGRPSPTRAVEKAIEIRKESSMFD
jgi:hypothetical protein